MNVLSVDFDWIMEPSIEAYNHLSCRQLLGPIQTWEKIKEIIPGLEPKFNLNKFHQLYFFLLHKGKELTQKDIYIGLNHSEINLFLQDDKKINLYNIDHHHDIGYPKNENDEKAFEGLGVANWVYFLQKDHKLSSYTWINNHNSVHPEKFVMDKIKRYSHSSDIELLDNIKFDKIFLCASWEWVPPEYEVLFDILVSTIDKR